MNLLYFKKGEMRMSKIKRFIIEVVRPYSISPDDFSKALKTYLDVYIKNRMCKFEVYNTMDERNLDINSGTHIIRYTMVKLENTIVGTRITDYDIDSESDTYYVTVSVNESVEFNLGGKFIPRALTSAKNVIQEPCKVIALDYVINGLQGKSNNEKGEKID